MKYYDQEVSNLKMQTKAYEEKLMQYTDELNNKDEQIGNLKNELQNLSEKYKIKGEEV